MEVTGFRDERIHNPDCFLDLHRIFKGVKKYNVKNTELFATAKTLAGVFFCYGFAIGPKNVPPNILDLDV